MDKIKLIVSDVDGVFTDGTKTYDKNGVCVAKNFCDRDFTAIQQFKHRDVLFCWLTGDRTINEAIAKDRGIDFFYWLYTDKLNGIIQILEHYNIKAKNTLYIGDDIFDIPPMKHVGYGACPGDANQEITDSTFCSMRLDNDGGHKAISELYYWLLDGEYI